MTYLNPDPSAVDDKELEHAAKFVYLANIDQTFCDVQVEVAIAITAQKFDERYDRCYALHGQEDTICFIIADIHHQGRAQRAVVQSALSALDPVQALLSIGKGRDKDRIHTLEEKMMALQQAGMLGTHKYDSGLGAFVDVHQPFAV